MIDSGTFGFLKDIFENNNREWFQDNKNRYQEARENILDFAAVLITEISRFDDTIPGDLNPADCVMRIYRDIRFSKDKTPYKTNFAVAISTNGKNFKGPGYYVHIEPGNSFAGGGTWHPQSEELKAIRQEIDYNPSEFLQILHNPKFESYFQDLDQDDKLKTVPKGYPAEHDLIDYLKLKSFTASHFFKDEALQGENSFRNVAAALESLYPLIVFLRQAIV